MNIYPFFRLETRKFFSSVNKNITCINSFGKKTVYIQGVAQSGGEYVYMWNKVMNGICTKQFKTALVLGVGGGTVIQSLLKFFPNIKITGVELDPIMIEIAKTFFLINEKRNILYDIDDANRWIRKNKNKKFDCIVVDLYIGRFNPSFSRSRNFLTLLKNMIPKKGTIIFNAHFQIENRKEYEDFIVLNKKIFNRVEEIFRYKFNRVLKFERL